MRTFGFGLVLIAAACGGGTAATKASADGAKGAADPASVYAPLEVGADYQTYHHVNKAAFESPTHGHRFVDVWVNDAGFAAYTSDAEMPVGSVIVKSSWETKDGKPTTVAGPLFVMEKRAKGYDAAHEDWWYALAWPAVPPEWVPRMGDATQVYWRSPSPKVAYCWGCHENYERNLGMPPKAQRAW